VPSLGVQTQTLAPQPSATLPPEKDKIKDSLGEFSLFTRTSSQHPHMTLLCQTATKLIQGKWSSIAENFLREYL
jgi:hypothetical protein